MKTYRYVLGFLLALFLASPVMASETYVRKVDNFFFLVDRSGSMDDVYAGTTERKIVLAKTILERINAQLPELGYQGALNTAGFAFEIQALQPYAAANYGAAIAQLPSWIGSNPTPLGDGLAALEPALKNAVGRSAVIILSDGQENEGLESLEVAKDLAAKYNVRFHSISFADSVNGNQPLLDAITAIKSGGVGVSAAQVANDSALKCFVQAVFYDLTSEAVQIDGDDDQDGVPNSKDLCPDTAMNLKVDTTGCPIPVKRELKVFFDFDKSVIKPAFHQELADFATFMKAYPGTSVVINGHTDSLGTDAYNKALSLRRATSVREYLIKNFQMKAARLKCVGLGESAPIADNNTEAGQARNRRIEAVLEGVYEKK